MKDAYALLGLLFLLIIAGAWYAFSRPATSLPINQFNATTTTMKLSSAAFAEGASIPAKYTCDGGQISPPLTFGGAPKGAVSLALIMDDPDVPKALKPDGVFDHWVLFNIPPATAGFAEGESAGTPGNNGAGKPQYTGPCPPPQYEPSEHRYVFTLYALDQMLALDPGASKSEVLEAMQGHILAQAQLVGRYKRAAQ